MQISGYDLFNTLSLNTLFNSSGGSGDIIDNSN